MADKGKDRRMTSGIGNTTTTRSFTIDRFEQEVANEIGLDRMHVTGRQGAVGKQSAVREASQISGKTTGNTTTSLRDTERQ